MEKTPRFQLTKFYRPDIQILRGIAVLAVIGYHLGFPIAGGFLGVDIFFVISGFLITGTLMRSKGSLTYIIILFYRKRLRRILPASVYITLLTLLASFLFLPRTYIQNYLLDAVSSIFMFSNLRFAKDGVDYLNQTLNQSPFLHFWSLGVEEQFYLLWPLFLLTLFRWKMLYYITIPSLYATCLISSHFFPTSSFFSPTSRAWEFLIGAFVATLPSTTFSKIRKIFFRLISSIYIAVLFLLIHPNSRSLQFYTLGLVLSVALLIYIGFSHKYMKTLITIGNISYPLYLIHWPIIAIFLCYVSRLTYLMAICVFLLSIFWAICINNFFENPVRYKQRYLISSKFWLTLISPILFISIIAFYQGFSINQSNRTFQINNELPAIYSNGCHTTTSLPKKFNCDFGDLNSKRLVMLVGDSHAAQWYPGFEKATLKRGIKLRVATKSGCPAILLTFYIKTSNSQCVTWQKNILRYINESNPDLVVISNLTENGGSYGKLGLTSNQYIQSLIYFIAKIHSKSKVSVIGDTPYPRTDIVTCLSLNWRNPSKCDFADSESKATEMTKYVSNFRTTYFNPRYLFCNEGQCTAIINKKNAYRDGSHISVSTVNTQLRLANNILRLIK